MAFATALVSLALAARLAASPGYLLLDPGVLISMSPNTVAVLGPVTKSDRNPLLSETEPYDGNWLNSNPSLVYQNNTFHLWWTTKLVCPGATPGRCTRNAATSDKCCHPGFNHTIPRNATGSGGLLYARSADGVSWQRPNLGRVEVLGSTNNNVVFKIVGSAASQVGIFFDDRTGRFRSFGKVYPPHVGGQPTQRGMGTAESFNGLDWTNWSSAADLEVNGDTSNNAIWDPHLQRYLGFSRLDNSIHANLYGTRKETISESVDFKRWAGHSVCLRGTASGVLDGESYALVPFRLPGLSAGVYLGLGAFYDVVGGIVTNELLRSTSYGRNWTRVAPGQPFIPHGKTLDNYTTYAARALIDPHDPDGRRVLMYYAGGDGPHSGRRRDYMMLATADASSMIGYGPGGGGRAPAVLETAPLAVVGSRLTLRLQPAGSATPAEPWHAKALAKVDIRLADGSICASGAAELANTGSAAPMRLAGVQDVEVAWSTTELTAGCAGASNATIRFEVLAGALFSFDFVRS